MKFNYRSFGSESHVPLPIALSEENLELHLIATPWGPTDVLEGVLSVAWSSLKGDLIDIKAQEFQEIVGRWVSNLHEQLKDDLNKEQYSSGFELLIILKKENMLHLASIGSMMILLSRDQFAHYNLVDGSVGLGTAYTSEQEVSGLPFNFVGGPDFQTHFHDLKSSAGDRLLIINQTSYEPVDMIQSAHDLEGCLKSIVTRKPKHGFWIGELK